MKREVNYKIVVEVEGKILTFTAKDISEDDWSISFTDKFGKNLKYNKKNVISCEEVSE